MKTEKWKYDSDDYVTLKNCSLIFEKEEYDFLKKRATEHYEDCGKSYTLNECIEMEIELAFKNYYEQEMKKLHIRINRYRGE